jgi:hypothetical protein
MDSPAFKYKHLHTLSDALDIAEDATGNFFKYSIAQWKRHRYDIKTLDALRGIEISKHAFALLRKCSGAVSGFEPKTKHGDFYFICLQDHSILSALKRDRELLMLPLLVYIFTHELVHIVRFCNFSQRFEATGKERTREEALVHEKTYEILRGVTLPKLDYVLEAYQDHRVFDMVASQESRDVKEVF